jgi:hypothetical protein
VDGDDTKRHDAEWHIFVQATTLLGRTTVLMHCALGRRPMSCKQVHNLGQDAQKYRGSVNVYAYTQGQATTNSDDNDDKHTQRYDTTGARRKIDILIWLEFLQKWAETGRPSWQRDSNSECHAQRPWVRAWNIAGWLSVRLGAGGPRLYHDTNITMAMNTCNNTQRAVWHKEHVS